MYFRIQDREVFITVSERVEGEPRFDLYKDAKSNVIIRLLGLYAVLSRRQ